MVLNIGHRGFGVHAIENTLSAFQLAIDFHLDMIELDVALTKDEEVIVFHDKSLKRLASVPVKIADQTLKELKQYYLFQRKNHNGTVHETIPTLREVIELTQNKIHLNIEIKNGGNNNRLLVKKIISLINEYNLKQHIIVSSFYRDILEYASEEDSSIRCGYLFHKKSKKENMIIKNCNLYSIHPHKLSVNKKIIQYAKDDSIKVFPWTVNSAKLMKKLVQYQVDGIITNYPLKLSNILQFLHD